MFKIKELAKERDITISALSEKISSSQPNLSGIVNNKVTPSIDMLQKIADALEVHISELFNSPNDNQFRCPKCGTTLEIKEV